MISVKDMYNRAMAIKRQTTITYEDLMSKQELEVWKTLNRAQRIGIILPFNLMLVTNKTDRRIVPSIKLNDNRIFINQT
ncbi:hypothetical protein [Staphylococcus borealis]|uniref:hypothetical protein n=2 Tax=Staphylococcus borealis TaxID=2742203 RepID=UPI0039E82CC1